MNVKSTYRIVSFNIKQFSDDSVFHHEGKDSRKNLDIIARIVNENNIDIIAIQEIRGKLAFKELISAIAYGYVQDITAEMLEEPTSDGRLLYSELMGADYLACKAGKWQGRWTHPNSKWGTAIGEEGYAFIWNTERVDLPENDRGRVQPVIKHKSEIYFVRPPFYGRFITKDIGVKFEIALLNTHILYTKNSKLKSLQDSDIDYELINSSDKAERLRIKRELMEAGLSPQEIDVLEQFSNKNDVERRRSEVNNLITEVLEREENTHGRYVFLIGDYNLNLENCEFDYKNRAAVITSQIVYGKRNADEKTYIIRQGQLSTLKSPPKKEKDPERLYEQLQGNGRFANNYDHVTHNVNMTDENGRQIYVSDPVSINVLDEFGMTNREYFERISDHLPIMFEVGF